MKKTMTMLVASLSFLTTSVFAGPFMSAEEITTLVSGKTVSGKGLKKDFTVRTYFKADGTMDGQKNGNKRSGKWHVNDDDMMCIEFDDGAGNCRYIKDNGDGTYSKVKVKGSGKMIPVLLYESIDDGNTM